MDRTSLAKTSNMMKLRVQNRSPHIKSLSFRFYSAKLHHCSNSSVTMEKLDDCN